MPGRDPPTSRSSRVWPAFTLFAVTLCLAACQGPTGYTKADTFWGTGYGYTDKALGGDEYSIIVNGTTQTAIQQVASVALLRAAYIAKDHGRTHFLIVGHTAETLTNRTLVTLPIGGYMVPVAEQARNEPHAILIVRLLANEGARPDGAIDADAVIAQIGPRLRSPK